MYRTLLLVAVSVPAILAGHQAENAPPAVAAPSTNLLPVLSMKSSPVMLVPVALRNDSDKLIAYAVDGDGSELDSLGGLLFLDGARYGKGFITSDKRSLTVDQVRKLKPRSSVVVNYRLPYIGVDPGTYELRLSYQIYPGSVCDTKFGLTPTKCEQTILLVVNP